MRIYPLNDNLVVRKMKVEQSNKGGIILPERFNEKNQFVEVVYLPEEIYNTSEKFNMKLKIGDKLILGNSVGTEVVIENDELIIVKNSDVLAIVK